MSDEIDDAIGKLGSESGLFIFKKVALRVKYIEYNKADTDYKTCKSKNPNKTELCKKLEEKKNDRRKKV